MDLSSGIYTTFFPEVATTFRGSASPCTTPILSSLNHSSCLSKGQGWVHPCPSLSTLHRTLHTFCGHTVLPLIVNRAQNVTHSQYVRCQQTHRQEKFSQGRERELATDLPCGAEGRRRQMVLGLCAPTAKSRGKKAALWKGSRGWKTWRAGLSPEGGMNKPRPSVLGRQGSSPREGTRPCSSC